MDKIRIGFVGAGSMGQMAHLRNYVVLPDCEVVAIAEVREKTAKLVGGDCTAHEALGPNLSPRPASWPVAILQPARL